MAENRLISRSEWATYMNTGTDDTPAWSRLGEGFTDLEMTYDAVEYARHYVHEKSKRTDVLGYAPSIAYSCDVHSGDPCIARIMAVTDGELVGSAAQVDILSVNLYEAAENGGCVAFRRRWAIIPDAKGAGTEALIATGAFRAAGDSKKGSFDEVQGLFTEA